MSIVAFRVTSEPGWPTDVEPFVDGVALSGLAATYEREHSYEPAGGYGGLVPDHFNFGDLSRYLIGDHQHQSPRRGHLWLLGCQCGEVGCWPLEATITATSEAVTWTAFRQPHRPERTYEGLGPFTFERGQYDAAIAEALEALRDGGS